MLGESTLQEDATDKGTITREGCDLLKFLASGIDGKNPTIWVSMLHLGQHVNDIIAAHIECGK